MENYPTVGYPTILDGYVSGKKLRIESLDGSERYIEPEKMAYIGLPGWGINYDGDGFHLKNAGPFVLTNTGRMWGVAHQQKYSSHGYLKASPDCYHRWIFWKQQEQKADENGVMIWQPGTEQGIYIRKGTRLFEFKCWRWDVAGTEGKHWIWSGGYAGGHWD